MCVACCCCQVIECRRILKWTYAYGYYSFADEDDPNTEQRRQFFEFLQGDAERILDQVIVLGAGCGCCCCCCCCITAAALRDVVSEGAAPGGQ
jgi:hypothetical protein